jgi:homoserine dehydrogenase
MAVHGESYAQVLAETKRLGYAEADESLDVRGWDTAHKASVLAWLAHGVWVHPERMIVDGIERIAPADFHHAATLGYRIKLIAVIARDFEANELSVRVHPTLLPAACAIANVGGVFNGISVEGDVVGTTVYIGRGAGQDATASAVIGDIADAVKLLRGRQAARGAGTGVPLAVHGASRGRRAPSPAPLSRIRSCYYLRLTVRDQPGVLARVAAVMARNRVSIASVIQNPAPAARHAGLPAGAEVASLVLTTHRSDEHAIRRALTALGRVSSVLEEPLLLRIEDFGD